MLSHNIYKGQQVLGQGPADGQGVAETIKKAAEGSGTPPKDQDRRSDVQGSRNVLRKQKGGQITQNEDHRSSLFSGSEVPLQMWPTQQSSSRFDKKNGENVLLAAKK